MKIRAHSRMATIRENDDPCGAKIYIGIRRDFQCPAKGYRIIASNGDDVDTSADPQPAEKCIEDIEASWRTWDTFEWLGNGGYPPGC
uniref:Uncharacterized protein n=1 Tax=viral metagenome TaxID=1070528 RepID=A0A6M3K4J0_9ZZZZ